MTSMKTVKFLRPLTPLVHPRPKFFPPFDLWRSISKKPPRQMITNQEKENIIQGWLLFVLRSFFLAVFCFQYQLINFDWLYFDSISDFWWLYTLLCIVAQKYHKFFFTYSYSHFSTHFAINLFYLHNTPCMWTNKIKSRQIQIDHEFYCWI